MGPQHERSLAIRRWLSPFVASVVRLPAVRLAKPPAFPWPAAVALLRCVCMPAARARHAIVTAHCCARARLHCDHTSSPESSDALQRLHQIQPPTTRCSASSSKRRRPPLAGSAQHRARAGHTEPLGRPISGYHGRALTCGWSVAASAAMSASAAHMSRTRARQHMTHTHVADDLRSLLLGVAGRIQRAARRADEQRVQHEPHRRNTSVCAGSSIHTCT